MGGKKPTMNEVKTAINNIIVEISRLQEAVVKLDSILLTYIEFKGDGLKWQKWLDKRIEEQQSKNQRDNEGDKNEPKSKKSGNSSGANRKTANRKKAVAKSNQ